MGRISVITKAVKTYDSKLFCKEMQEGKLAIFREAMGHDVYVMDDGSKLINIRPAPHLVFYLTHNWRPQGNPVEWGVLPILARLKQSDLWKRDIVSDIEKNEERIAKENDRDRQNKTEDFLYDFHAKFKKTFSDVNVSTMEKKDRRRLADKQIKS